MAEDMARARIVVTNYHAFRRREAMQVSKVGRSLLQGRGEAPVTTETEHQMLERCARELERLQEHRRHQRRGPPLLPRTPGRSRHRTPNRPGPRGGEAEQGGRPPLDFRAGGREAQAGRQHDLRPVRHAVLPQRLGLPGGHAVPLDMQRLLPHGCDRERHRQAAPRARVGQPAARRDADVPQPLGPHRQADAQGRGGKGRQAEPAAAALQAANGAVRPLRPLREDLPRLGRRGHRRAPVFIVVCNNTATSLLVHEWIAGFERTAEGEQNEFHNGHLALFRNYDDHGPTPRTAHDAADRQRADRERRGAGQGLPRSRLDRDRAVQARARSTPGRRPGADDITDQTCCARS